MPTDLTQRVAELEQRLTVVEAALAVQQARPSTDAPARPAPAPKRPATPLPKIDWEQLGSGEGWLGRAGIGLLIVGLILLYRYAVVQGWLTPGFRIGIGLVVGLGLLVSGSAFFPDRRPYRQILTGGGIVILFITGLAAAELYHLIRGTVALLYFAALTAVSFSIGARQEEPTIASIGAIGALIPPAFLLADSVPGSVLWLYLLLIVLWTGLLVVLRGWPRTMLVTAAVSVIATYHTVPNVRNVQIAAALVLAAAWICYAALPLLHARVTSAPDTDPRLQATLVLVLPTTMTIALAIAATAYIFRAPHSFDIAATIGAAGFGAIALRRSTHDPDPIEGWVTIYNQKYAIDGFSAAATACVLSLAAAAIAGIVNPWWNVALAALALFALLLASMADAALLRPVAHALNGLLAIGFLLAVGAFSSRGPFDDIAVSYIIVTVIAAAVGGLLLKGYDRIYYLGAVYFAVHVLLATELTAVRAAPWLASAAYGVVGSTLLITGLAKRQALVQRAGLLSLALLVARLFLYDLANVNVGVRIVLFMACGFVFLGLSYLVRSRRFAA